MGGDCDKYLANFLMSTESEDTLQLQLEAEGIATQQVQELKQTLRGEIEHRLPTSVVAEGAGDSKDMRQILGAMTIPEKIKAAMFGNSECRAILISDKNRMIQEYVLQNPKLSIGEIQDFAASPNSSQHVLRGIASNRDWIKEYKTKLALVKNPKTPPDISLKWIRYLHTGDIRNLSKSKNIPQVVAVAAKKKLAEMQKKR